MSGETEDFTAIMLGRISQLEVQVQATYYWTERIQNSDDLGVALRFVDGLLTQYGRELDLLQQYLDQFEAMLNLLEARS